MKLADKVLVPGRSTGTMSVSKVTFSGESYLKDLYVRPGDAFIAMLDNGTIVMSGDSVVERSDSGVLSLREGLQHPDDYLVVDSVEGFDLKPNAEVRFSGIYPVSMNNGASQDSSMKITYEPEEVEV